MFQVLRAHFPVMVADSCEKLKVLEPSRVRPDFAARYHT